jgi:hypothetical protein
VEIGNPKNKESEPCWSDLAQQQRQEQIGYTSQPSHLFFNASFRPLQSRGKAQNGGEPSLALRGPNQVSCHLDTRARAQVEKEGIGWVGEWVGCRGVRREEKGKTLILIKHLTTTSLKSPASFAL